MARALVCTLVSALLVSVLVMASGCGGQTGPAPGEVAEADGGGNGGGLPRTKLPECREGPPGPFGGNAECPWRADGKCYDTKLEACACVCPTEDSICISGFRGGEVDCD